MFNNEITEIVPHLFLSNWFSSNNPNVLYKNKIKAVLTLETIDKPVEILQYQRANNIQSMYIRIPDAPNADISQYFDLTYDFIDKYISKGENVLVHCYAGVSRSATIVLNYIIRKYFETATKPDDPQQLLQSALQFVRRQRPVVNPNQGFLNQLLNRTVQYSSEFNAKYNKKHNKVYWLNTEYFI